MSPSDVAAGKAVTTACCSHDDGPARSVCTTRVDVVWRDGNHRTSGTRYPNDGSKKYSACCRKATPNADCDSTMPSAAWLMRHSPPSCANAKVSVCAEASCSSVYCPTSLTLALLENE